MNDLTLPSGPAGVCANCGVEFSALGEAISLCPSCRSRSSGTPAQLPPERDLRDQQIGPYRLVQCLATGGMGEVYAAEQREPVRRMVALKIVKLGMDSQEVLRRFEAERQALALMDHPYIAKVFDAGTAPSGRPYFVMELIDGLPITDYCDRHRLTPRQRIELFVKVCEAVQHAHQRGIIHRDIKPSNILVEEIDGVASPKVIDFGIAKALGQELTERTLQTQIGDLLGTPQYMSPEQALGCVNEVDTTSDVYSLGIVLYELLTGQTPLTSEQICAAGMLGVAKLFHETQPRRPSTKLSSLGKEAKTVAERRHTDATALSRSLRRELDWVTLKCLEREKQRRYQTVNALARDLQRHLANEVVEARPPSAAYRFRKLASRNKGLVVTTLTLLVCLTAGMAVTGYALWREGKALERELAERKRAEQSEALALQEAQNAKQIAEFMQGLLTRAAEEAHRGKSAEALIAAIDAQKANLAKTLGDQPEVLYQVHVRLFNIYHSFGRGREAIDLAKATIPLADKLYGPNDQETLARMHWLAHHLSWDNAAKLAIYDTCVARRRATGETPATSPDLVMNLTERAHAMRALERLQEAKTAYLESVAAREQYFDAGGPRNIGNLRMYALALSGAGRLEDAWRAFQECDRLAASSLSPDYRLMGDILRSRNKIIFTF